MKKEQRKRDGGKLNGGSQPMSTDSEGKSIAGDDDPKSPSDSVKSQGKDHAEALLCSQWSVVHLDKLISD